MDDGDAGNKRHSIFTSTHDLLTGKLVAKSTMGWISGELSVIDVCLVWLFPLSRIDTFNRFRIRTTATDVRLLFHSGSVQGANRPQKMCHSGQASRQATS